MARASCEGANFETCTISTFGFSLLIADGWKTTAGDPVVPGFTFKLEVLQEIEQIAMLFKYFPSALVLVKMRIVTQLCPLR